MTRKYHLEGKAPAKVGHDLVPDPLSRCGYGGEAAQEPGSDARQCAAGDGPRGDVVGRADCQKQRAVSVLKTGKKRGWSITKRAKGDQTGDVGDQGRQHMHGASYRRVAADCLKPCHQKT
jgi:hypothetical protein